MPAKPMEPTSELRRSYSIRSPAGLPKSRCSYCGEEILFCLCGISKAGILWMDMRRLRSSLSKTKLIAPQIMTWSACVGRVCRNCSSSFLQERFQGRKELGLFSNGVLGRVARTRQWVYRARFHVCALRHPVRHGVPLHFVSPPVRITEGPRQVLSARSGRRSNRWAGPQSATSLFGLTFN